MKASFPPRHNIIEHQVLQASQTFNEKETRSISAIFNESEALAVSPFSADVDETLCGGEPAQIGPGLLSPGNGWRAQGTKMNDLRCRLMMS